MHILAKILKILRFNTSGLGAKRTKNIWAMTWQKEREDKHNEWLSFREIGCTIYLDW